MRFYPKTTRSLLIPATSGSRSLAPLPRRCGLLAAAALSIAAPLAASADVYQFIVSGYPAANVSYPSASAGTSLVTATFSAPAAAAPLEARYRTFGESVGIDLCSDKRRGTTLIIR